MSVEVDRHGCQRIRDQTCVVEMGHIARLFIPPGTVRNSDTAHSSNVHSRSIESSDYYMNLWTMRTIGCGLRTLETIGFTTLLSSTVDAWNDNTLHTTIIPRRYPVCSLTKNSADS
jgi:hypothetical protein